jgi:hypothetical protein
VLRRPDAFRAKPANRSRCAASRQSFQELADEAFKDVFSSFGSASGAAEAVCNSPDKTEVRREGLNFVRG